LTSLQKITSFGGRDLQERFAHADNLRNLHLPIFPSPVHPDNGIQLFLHGGARLPRESYVNTKQSFEVNPALLRAFSQNRYRLKDESYTTLVRFMNQTTPSPVGTATAVPLRDTSTLLSPPILPREDSTLSSVHRSAILLSQNSPRVGGSVYGARSPYIDHPVLSYPQSTSSVLQLHPQPAGERNYIVHNVQTPSDADAILRRERTPLLPRVDRPSTVRRPQQEEEACSDYTAALSILLVLGATAAVYSGYKLLFGKR